MSQTLEIRLPPLWRALPTSAHGAVLHADLDVRAMDSMLALVLERAFSKEQHVALVLPNNAALERAKWRLGEWLPESRIRSVAGACVCETYLWLTTELEAIPVDVTFTYVVDAHLFIAPPKLAPLALVAGVATTYGHWFRQYAESVECVRWNDDVVCATFPDQHVKRLPTTHAQYAQLMRLSPDAPRVHFNFRSFASTRLKVRSDKGPMFLSTRQQEEARRQLGDNWASGRDGTPIVSFELSPLQKRYLAIKRHARSKGYNKFLLLKYRRGGLTTIEQAISYALATVAARSQVITLAHTRESTSRIFRIATTYHENDPHALPLIGDSKSSIELSNGSLFFIGTAGGRGVARGDTLARVHGSEVSRWCIGPRQNEAVSDLIAGLSGAASNGEVVLETTPNGNEWFAAAYRDAKRKLNSYYPIFLRWFDDPANAAAPGTFSEEELRDTVTEEEISLCRRHGLTWAQLAFRRAIQKEYKHLAAQEYPEDDETCFLNSGLCYFDVTVLSPIYMALQQRVSKRIALPGGWLTEFAQPEPGVEYVAGCDTSEGIPGCDPNGVGVMRRDTGEQVASLHGYFKPDELAAQAATLCRRYNNALLAVERENHGHAVLLALRSFGAYGQSHLTGGRLFYHKEDRAGWSTNEQTRPLALNTLASYIVDCPEQIHDAEFVSECLSFRLQPSGKFEADPGCHDDSVMKWAIAAQMRMVRVTMPGIRILKGSL